MRILAKTFSYSAPTGIPSNIDHGCKGPLDADGWALDCCDSASGLGESGVERGCLSEGNGEDGSESMDNIFADK